MAINSHLDANQVSALLGGELRGAPRRKVIVHLSQCAECRQWAGLTQSARGTGMPMAAPTRRSWTIYALPAAAALALAGALWLRPALPVAAPAPPRAAAVHAHRSISRRPEPAHAASLRAPALAPAPAEHTPISAVRSSATAVADVGAAVDAAPAAGVAAADVLVVPTPAPRSTAALAALPAPSAPSGEFRPSIDFSPLMTGFQDQTPETTAGVQFADQFLPTAPSHATPDAAGATAIANPVPAMLAARYTQGFAPAVHRTRPLSGPYAPRPAPARDGALGWTVSRGGALLHSIGAGIWAAVPLVPGLHFRAVFASGAHIWVGADADQLFASADSGAHWRHLALPEPSPHAAHINSIEFSDTQRGVVRLDDGHVWVTADGGATWMAGQ